MGKTTLSVTLASYLYSMRAARVLLIDFDPQFNASQYLMSFEDYAQHVRHKGTIADLLIDSPLLRLRGKSQKKPSIAKCITTLDADDADGSKLDFLPSELALAHVVKNPNQMDFRLEKLLARVRDNYDYVFIDCAPTDSVLTTMALTASGFVLVPMKPDRFSILGLANLLETLNSFRENSPDPNSVTELGLVFTIVRNDSTIEQECIDEVRALAEEHDWHVFEAQLPYSTTFQRSIRDQTAPFQTKWARHGVKRAIGQLVSEIEQRVSELQDNEDL